MNRKAISTLAGLLLLSGTPSYAQQTSDQSIKAGALRDACNPAAAMDVAAKAAADRTCQSYLRGMADGIFLLGAVQDTMQVCLPKEGPLSTSEIKSEFQDYLAAHPDAASHTAGLAIIFGVIAAHPCE